MAFSAAPSRATGRAWALAAYPVPAARRESLESALGRPIDIRVLSEIRRAGARNVLAQIRKVDADVAYALVDSVGSSPLLPVLALLVSLTPCRRLGVIDAEGAFTPLDRRAGLLGALRRAGGTVRGAWAAVACALDLLTRRDGHRVPVTLPARPRVAYLKATLWFGVKAGGSVAHVAGVINGLVRRGANVSLFAVDEQPLLDPSVESHVIRGSGLFGLPFELNYYAYDREFVREARRVLERARPDLIYQRLSISSYAGLRLARELGVPFVLEYNGSEVWAKQHWGLPLRFGWLARRTEQESLRGADLVVTVSSVLGHELHAMGVPPHRIVVHPNGVDPDQFDSDRVPAAQRLQIRQRYGIAPDATVCGFIGSFGKWHGVTVLAEAIRHLVEEQESWLRERKVHFMLIGDGLLMPDVRRILGDPATARYTTLTGLVDQAEAPRYLATADVLVSPHIPNEDGSRFFGSPTKLFEYMAMAKGIVASDLEQIGEVLKNSYHAAALPVQPCQPDDDKLAVLTRPGDRAQLIAALRFLVERPDYRISLGRNARREVLASYTWERHVAAMMERLQKTGR